MCGKSPSDTGYNNDRNGYDKNNDIKRKSINGNSDNTYKLVILITIILILIVTKKDSICNRNEDMRSNNDIIITSIMLRL